MVLIGCQTFVCVAVKEGERASVYVLVSVCMTVYAACLSMLQLQKVVSP